MWYCSTMYFINFEHLKKKEEELYIAINYFDKIIKEVNTYYIPKFS